MEVAARMQQNGRKNTGETRCVQKLREMRQSNDGFDTNFH